MLTRIGETSRPRRARSGREPLHKGAVRARGEASLEVQGVQRLSARSSALSVQGVRWASICEHGRQRSKCKECGGKGICEHGRQRSQCKECGGSSICEHGRQRSDARSAVGHQSASTVVSALVQGVRWGINLRARSSSALVQGVRWCINLRARSSAHEVQGVRCKVDYF